MTTAITVDTAKINTFTISVKVLQVGNRQVTLSVFRQLPNEDIFDEQSLTLRGRPWGHVNYHPEGCHQSDEHLHVVWQKDVRLLRCRMNRSVGSGAGERMYSLKQKRAALFTVAVLEEFLANPDAATIDGAAGLVVTQHFRMGVQGTHRYQAQQKRQDGSPAPWQEMHRKELENELEDHRKQAGDELKLLRSIGYAAAREDLMRREKQIAVAWQAAYDGIQQLDQLFIAL